MSMATEMQLYYAKTENIYVGSTPYRCLISRGSNFREFCGCLLSMKMKHDITVQGIKICAHP